MKIILKDNLNDFYINDKLFNINFNKTLIHQVYTSYLSNIRQNTKLNKNRSNVSGSNKKPWKQKGTGRARSGCLRSPIWRSGGVTFGNQVKNYKKKINKKMYKLACRSLFSKFINENNLFLFNEFKLDKIKTKDLYEKIIKYCNNKERTIILTYSYNDFLFKSSNNIFFLSVKCVSNINLISIIKFKYIILCIKTYKILEQLLI